MKNIIKNEKRQKLNRPITGIIQEDRIWEQWYDQDIFTKKLPKMSQKDYLFECIGDDPNRTIIDNRGLKKINVREFEKMILDYEKAFSAFNFKKGDVICTIGLTTPEMYAIKYASTSLGLITCNLNVMDIGIADDGKNRLYRQLENIEPKMIFTLDILEDKIYPVLNNTKFNRTIKVSMPLENYTPKYNPERLIMGLKVLKDHLSGKKINNTIELNDFLELGKNINEIDEKYVEGMPCNISFTSGTTGINKAVLLSHDANNALAFQQIKGEFGFKKGTKHLALVPPFLAFWDADIVHASLCLGNENIIDLFLDYKKIPKYFKKYDIVNGGIWSQYLWSSILELKEKDLKKVRKNLEFAIVGGERCEINEAERFYNVTGVMQLTGFGASEINTTFSINHPNCNKIGTAGLPLPFNNVKIVDESFKDVTYNVPGKLFITGPTLMNGYYKRDDLTNKALYIDKYGTKWYNTGDYAIIDEDGCLTVLDRYMEPVEIKNDDTTENVNMLDIIEKIKTNRNIKNCKMTYHNGKLALHLSIDSYQNISEEMAIESIESTIRLNLPKKYWPNIIKVYNELPRTQVGKIDYKELNKIGNELIGELKDNTKLKFVLEEKNVKKIIKRNIK